MHGLKGAIKVNNIWTLSYLDVENTRSAQSRANTSQRLGLPATTDAPRRCEKTAAEVLLPLPCWGPRSLVEVVWACPRAQGERTEGGGQSAPRAEPDFLLR